MAAAQSITIERHLRSVHVDRSASQVALTRRTAQSITIERHLRSVGRAGVSSPLTRRSSRPLTRRSKKPFGCSSVGNRLARATEALLRTRVKRSNREATKPHALSRGSSIPDDPPPPLTHLFALRASVGPCWSVVTLSGRVVSADCAVWWAWGSFGRFVRCFVAFDGYLGRVSSHRTTSISITNNPALVRHSTLVRCAD